MAKYKTREDSLNAVKINGKNLCDVEDCFKDDEEIVLTAISNGGNLELASMRLQNDLAFVLKEANIRDPFDFDFFKAVFCCKNDIKLIPKFNEMYKSSVEFQLILKIYYDGRYISPIRKLNFMSKDELNNELFSYRMSQIKLAREIYLKGYTSEYLHEKSDIDVPNGGTALFGNAVSLREKGFPFSKITEFFSNQIKYERDIIVKYSSQQLKGSYPEKIIASLLKILNVDFSREVVFPWSMNILDDKGRRVFKRYDFYIPSLSTIIEVHGAQHYEGGFEYLGGRSLDEEIENDRLKKVLAVDNGVEHYITINASISSVEYIKNSVIANKEFCELFNIENINWNEVENGIFIHNDNYYPLFEERLSFYNEWDAVVKASILPDDEVCPEPINSNSKPEISMEIRKRNNQNLKASRMKPYEILMLKESNYYKYPISKDNMPKKWFYDYGIEDPCKCFNDLINRGYLTVGSIRLSVENENLAKIKRILSDHGLSTKGCKADLVESILNSFTEDKLSELFPVKYLELTRLGRETLEKNDYVNAKERCGLSLNTLSRLSYAFPKQKIDDILLDYCKQPKNYVKFLSKEECRYIITEDKEDNYIINLRLRMFSLYEGKIYKNNKNYRESLKKYLHILYLDIVGFEYENRLFEGETKDIQLMLQSMAPGIVSEAKKLINNLSLNKIDVYNILNELIPDMEKCPSDFENQEIINIIAAILENDYDQIVQVYQNARNRPNYKTIVHAHDVGYPKLNSTKPKIKIRKFRYLLLIMGGILLVIILKLVGLI